MATARALAESEHVNENPTDNGRPNIKYWIGQLAAAEKAAEPAQSATARAWREYLQELPKKSEKDAKVKARYPIYWASIKTMQPAIYNRTPDPTVDKVFDDLPDELARVSALCLERLAKYVMRRTPFDRVMYATRDEFLHGGKTAPRVCFDSEIRVEPVKVRYHEQQIPQMVQDPATGQPVPTGQADVIYLDSLGQPPPDDAELQQDEIGYYAETTNEEVDRVGIELVPVHYSDILHSPSARHHEEIDWIAYKSLLTRGDVEDRFGRDMVERLAGCFKAADDDNDSDRDKDTLPGLYATVWEIWDKRRREVYWLCPSYTDEFIDTQADLYGLEAFFPSPPFMLGTVGPDSLYVTPDYVQLEPLINQMHGMAERFRKLVRSTRRRGVYDKNITELQALATDTDEGEFIGIGQWQKLVADKGGLANAVQFFPVEPLVSAIQEMANVMQLYEQTFNEIFGIPDILRGTSDPSETATAQQLKGKFTSNRFSAIQREFQRLCRDSIELMTDLALKKFPEQKLASIMGIGLMTPEEQALWPQILEMLRDDTERKVRIDIETDSTITLNENAEIEQRNYLAKSMFDGLAAVATASQQNPKFAAAASQVLVYTIQGLRKGKEVEKTLTQLAEQLTQDAAQPQQPPPDPAMMKAQAQAQALQMKTQADIAATQAKTQADMQRDTVKAQNAMQVEKAQLDHDAMVLQLRMQMEQQQAQFKMQMEQTQAEMKRDIEMLKAAAKIRTDQQRARSDATAKMAEHAFEAPPPGNGDVHLHFGSGGTESKR